MSAVTEKSLSEHALESHPMTPMGLHHFLEPSCTVIPAPSLPHPVGALNGPGPLEGGSPATRTGGVSAGLHAVGIAVARVRRCPELRLRPVQSQAVKQMAKPLPMGSPPECTACPADPHLRNTG